MKVIKVECLFLHLQVSPLYSLGSSVSSILRQCQTEVIGVGIGDMTLTLVILCFRVRIDPVGDTVTLSTDRSTLTPGP